MKTKITILTLLSVVLFLLFLPLIINPEPYNPAELRQQYNVQSIELTNGVIHYEDIGSGDMTILYVPGFSMPMFIWDKQFETVASKGIRSIRFNYYSRGFSDAPRGVYTKEAYASLVNELIDSLKLDNVIIMGHSLGGAVATLAVMDAPEYYRAVILSDPMLDGKTGNPATPLIALPLLGEWLNRLFIGRVIEKRANDLLTLAGYSDTTHYRVEMRRQARTKGYHNSIVEIFRGNLLENCTTQYAKLGDLDIPVLLICGSTESITPDSHPDEIKNVLPNATMLNFPEACHMAHVKSYEEVNREIIQFIANFSQDTTHPIQNKKGSLQ